MNFRKMTAAFAVVSVFVVLGFALVLPAQAATNGAIAGQYIVVLKDSSTGLDNLNAVVDKVVHVHKGKVKHRYTTALKGFSVAMNESEVAKVAADPAVAYVEQDQLAHASTTQSSPDWGLDRIDQRGRTLSGTYTYPNIAGNVTAYVLDSGIRISHADFGGRAVNGHDFINDDSVANDCNGHGTHVAGTIGSSTYGVAKGVRLVGVRVLDCGGSGAYSDIIAGIDWVTRNAHKPAVANMSLGGSPSSTLDNAVQRSIDAGVTYTLAGGNDGTSACNQSPARAAAAITVGATNANDQRSIFSSGSSNFGSCLDIWAPGSNILSTTASSNTSTGRMSGTSMASPHVAGAAALVLAANPSYTPAQVRARLVATATSDVLSNIMSGSPNKLLFVEQSGAVSPPPSCGPFTNAANVTISDFATSVSPLAVSGCSGAASAGSQIAVDIKHTFRGDLQIDLIAPDGTSYRLKNANANDSADNVNTTYTANLSGEARNGTWKLSVYDTAQNDVGYIDSWSLAL